VPLSQPVVSPPPFFLSLASGCSQYLPLCTLFRSPICPCGSTFFFFLVDGLECPHSLETPFAPEPPSCHSQYFWAPLRSRSCCRSFAPITFETGNPVAGPLNQRSPQYSPQKYTLFSFSQFVVRRRAVPPLTACLTLKPKVAQPGSAFSFRSIGSVPYPKKDVPPSP